MPRSTTKKEELVGQFLSENIVKGSDSERWIVGVLSDGSCVVGNAEKGKLKPGLEYRFLGRWSNNPRYGMQFLFSSFCDIEPTDPAAMQRYLALTTGIGSAKATAIVASYGDKALEFCRDDPERVSEDCKIRIDVARALSDNLRRSKALERITMELDSLLHGGGFPKQLIDKLIEEWGEDAAATIKENPFSLLVFPGVGFRKCDALYQRLGLPMGSMVRQMHCAAYAVQSDFTGSTWVPESSVVNALKEMIAGSWLNVEEAVKLAIEEDLLVVRDGHYSTSANARAESDMVSYVIAARAETLDEFGM